MRSALPIVVMLGACAAAPPPVSPPSAPRTADLGAGGLREDAPIEPRFTLERDGLPPAFAYLAPRDREQWHACRAFFLRRRPGSGCRHGACGTPMCGPCNAEIHLEFSLHVTDYLREPDAPARRALLIANGCPEGIVELADGTHLDLVEPPKAPDP